MVSWPREKASVPELLQNGSAVRIILITVRNLNVADGWASDFGNVSTFPFCRN
jgi:hypothetical protein